jgi:hypothetical protein
VESLVLDSSWPLCKVLSMTGADLLISPIPVPEVELELWAWPLPASGPSRSDLRLACGLPSGTSFVSRTFTKSHARPSPEAALALPVVAGGLIVGELPSPERPSRLDLLGWDGTRYDGHDSRRRGMAELRPGNASTSEESWLVPKIKDKSRGLVVSYQVWLHE